MDAELTGRVAGDGVRGDERHDQTLLVLGATRDLTSRLLLPGLGGLLTNGDRRRLSLIRCGRDDWDDARWRQRVLESFSAADADRPEAVSVARRPRYVRADVTNDNDLRQRWSALTPRSGGCACRVSTAPRLLASLLDARRGAASTVQPDGLRSATQRYPHDIRG